MSTAIDQTLSELLEDVGSLPPVAARIVALTADPGCTLTPLAEVIGCDPPMTLRFLALANSAAVFRGNPVRTLREALVRLGLRRTRDVALLMGMHDLVPLDGKMDDLDPVDFWKFTLATAATSSLLARGFPGVAESDAWLAGLLHGIGLPILFHRAPAAFARARKLARMRQIPLTTAETEVLGFHHGHIAARLLDHWHLPEDLAAAMSAGQHVPGHTVSPLGNVLDLARRFVRGLGYGENGDGDPPPEMSAIQPDLEAAGWNFPVLANKVGRMVQHMSSLIDLDLTSPALESALEISRQRAARIGLEGINDSLTRQELEEDSRQARGIQRRLLPKDNPSWPGYALAAANIPGRRVSGDAYDFPPTGSRNTALMITDVSGKGIPAALLASNLQACVRSLAPVIPDPGLLLATINQTLLETTDDEHFATMFLAILEPPSGRLWYASAGHPPALLLHGNGPPSWLPASCPPLGLLPGTTYDVGIITLEPGDSLVLYTDGVSEAVDPRQHEFGRMRIAREIAAAPSGEPEILLQSLLQAVLSHCAGTPEAGTRGLSGIDQDDMTVVILKRLDLSAPQ